MPLTTRLLLCESLAACRDVTPSHALGRVISAALMLGAIGCLGVITARGELNARVARIEAAVIPALSGGSSDGVS